MSTTEVGKNPGEDKGRGRKTKEDILARNFQKLLVEDVMTTDPVCVEVPGSRSAALELMAKHTFSGLPVVKKRTRELVGGITRHDIFENPAEEQLAIIMQTDIQTIARDATLGELAGKIVSTGCYRVVIVDENNAPEGIVTPDDLLFGLESKDFDRPVTDFENGSVCVPVFRRTPLPVVAHIMRISHRYSLPVLDEELHVVGMVADIDLFSRTDVDVQIVRSDLGIGLDDDEWSWDGIRNIMSIYNTVSRAKLPMIPVEEVMVKDPFTAYRHTGVSTAAHRMRKHDIAQLPILDPDDRLQAMIRSTDLLKAILDQ